MYQPQVNKWSKQLDDYMCMIFVENVTVGRIIHFKARVLSVHRSKFVMPFAQMFSETQPDGQPKTL
jgi:hypothetical protein